MYQQNELGWAKTQRVSSIQTQRSGSSRNWKKAEAFSSGTTKQEQNWKSELKRIMWNEKENSYDVWWGKWNKRKYDQKNKQKKKKKLEDENDLELEKQLKDEEGVMSQFLGSLLYGGIKLPYRTCIPQRSQFSFIFFSFSFFLLFFFC